MARPRKDGLDYYPMDVNFLGDIKVKKVIRSHGIQAVAVILHLLGTVYRDTGYYATYDDDLLFITADELNLEEKYVKDVVEKLLEVDFFSREQAEKNKVLTSIGIQERYRKATERRISVNINDSLCIQKPRSSEVNVDRSTQSKVKESKVKESKGEGEEMTSAAVDEIMGYYSSNIHPVSSPVEKDKLIALVETHGDAFVYKAIERAVMRNKRSLAYITGILNRWEANGYDEGISESHKSSRNQWQHSEDYERFMREREEHKRKLRQRGS